jgi:polyisoprenoid-binding protein YceI
VSQFFHSNPAARPSSGPKQGPWRRDLPRSWQAAFDLSDAPQDLPTETGAYRLGPEDGTLSLRTGRTGAAAKAGHDLLIHVTAWEATLMAGDDPADTSIELNADGRSLRVREGTGGMKSLTDDDKAEIAQAIDDEILKGQAIMFRSTQVRPADGGGLSVQGDLTLVGETRPIAFDLAASDDGAFRATLVVTQTDWGIKPYAILFGALKVADEVEVGIDVRLPAELIPALGPRAPQSL